MEIYLTIKDEKKIKLSSGTFVATMKLCGELDLGQPALLLHEKVEELELQGILYIIMDFSEIKICHPDWLIILLEGWRKRGGEIYFVKVPEKVLHIFKFLGCEEFFQIFSTEQEAIQSI